jgi:hypothetical protein
MLTSKLISTILLAAIVASLTAVTPATARGGGARPHGGGFQNAPSFQNAPGGSTQNSTNPTGSNRNSTNSNGDPNSLNNFSGYSNPAPAGAGNGRYACIIGIAGVANCTVTGTANASRHTPCACGHYYGFTR